jgi:hypothetical protein
MTSESIENIAVLPLAHYDHGVHEFWQRTRDHEVSQTIAARCATTRHLRKLICLSLSAVKVAISHHPGIGHHPTSLAGATRLATLARAWQLSSKRRIHRTDADTAPIACRSNSNPGWSAAAQTGGLRVEAPPRK